MKNVKQITMRNAIFYDCIHMFIEEISLIKYYCNSWHASSRIELVGTNFASWMHEAHYISFQMRCNQPNITHNHITFQMRCNQLNITHNHICISKCMNSDQTFFRCTQFFKMCIPNITKIIFEKLCLECTFWKITCILTKVW